MLDRDIARLAYAAPDGTPRVVPIEYMTANSTYEMTSEQRREWEVEVRSLYASMVRIVVTPTWAKLIDFERTLPSAVEELVRQREHRRAATDAAVAD